MGVVHVLRPVGQRVAQALVADLGDQRGGGLAVAPLGRLRHDVLLGRVVVAQQSQRPRVRDSVN